MCLCCCIYFNLWYFNPQDMKILCKNSSTLVFYGATLVKFCVFFTRKLGARLSDFFEKWVSTMLGVSTILGVNHAACVNQKIGVKSYLLVKSATSYDSSAFFGLEFLCPYPIYHANHQLPCALEP